MTDDCRFAPIRMMGRAVAAITEGSYTERSSGRLTNAEYA